MRRLEGWRVPKRFHGRAAPIGEVGTRIAPVFRDRDELPTTSDLGQTIRAALRESATLVVICSPTAAKSRWVREEIVEFKRLHGERRVFGFIVSGEPKAEGTAEDCFSPALRAEVGGDGELSAKPAEIVAADARATGDGKEAALVRLLAGLLGVGFDELRQREQARRLRRMTWIAAGSAVGMAAMLGLAVTAWRAQNDAQRRQANADDLLTFMLGDLRDELKKIGRLSVLDSVGEKAMAYFDSLDVRDVTDAALVRQATALTQIGENRLDQARYAEASAAFAKALARAQELVARHPADKEMQFARARAEHWMGFTDLKRRELPATGRWFERYRDAALGLLALDPADERSRHEVAYAQQSLAVLRVETGEFAAAQPAFAAERAILEQMLAANPHGGQLRFEISVNESWQGVVAERTGRLAEASQRFGASATMLEELVADDPDTAQWRRECANRHLLAGRALALIGERTRAQAALTRAGEMVGPIVTGDAQNIVAAGLLAAIESMQAELALAEDRATEARALLGRARVRMEAIVQRQKSSPNYAEQLARILQLTIAAEGAPVDEEAGLAARTLSLLEPFLGDNAPGERIVRSGLAQGCLMSGRIAARRGDGHEARRQWQRAVDLLLPAARTAGDWRLLDPLTRALGLLGQEDESGVFRNRLAAAGYRPLAPWEKISPAPAPELTKPIAK